MRQCSFNFTLLRITKQFFFFLAKYQLRRRTIFIYAKNVISKSKTESISSRKKTFAKIFSKTVLIKIIIFLNVYQAGKGILFKYKAYITYNVP